MSRGCVPACASCVNREEDEWVCDDCDNGDGYVLDESLIEIGEDGRMGIRNERLGP